MTPSQDNYPFWTFEELGLLLGAILPALVIGMLAVRLGKRVAPAMFSMEAVQTLVFQALIYGLMLGALYWLVAKRYSRPFWRSLGWTLRFRGAWLCVAAAPVLALGLSALAALLHAPVLPNPVENMISGDLSLAVVILFATVAGPVFEELVFRGFLFPLFQRVWGPWPAIVAVAVPFTALHGSQYQWSWQHLLSVGLAGVAFGYARYKTISTTASTILHSGYNVTLFGLYLVQRA